LKFDHIENDRKLIDKHETLVVLNKKVKKMEKQLKEKIGNQASSIE
jgi:hypothetical protein